MGFGLLLGIKGKLRTLFEDLGDSHSHPLKDTTLRFFKWPMVEGSLVIAIPPKPSSSRPSTFPKISGNSSSFEQPDKMRDFRDVNLLGSKYLGTYVLEL